MNRLHGELSRFLVVGIGSNVLNYIAYLFTYMLGTSLAIASGVGYLVGLYNSYYFGKTWVFNRYDLDRKSAITRFTIVYALGGIGMSIIIEGLGQASDLDYRILWFFGAAFAFANNFLGSKWFVFKKGD